MSSSNGGNTQSVEVTILSLVKKADPDWQKERSREREYVFSNGRVFTADRSKRGAYAP